MSEVVFAPAVPDEAEEIIDFVTQSRLDTYFDLPGAGKQWADDFRALMESPQTVAQYQADIRTSKVRDTHVLFRTARAAGRLVGMIHVDATSLDGPATYELRKFHVAADAQGAGLGTRLMHEFLSYWPWVSPHVPSRLQVVKGNDRTIQFYRRFGYEIAPDGDDIQLGLPVHTMYRPTYREFMMQSRKEFAAV